MKFTVTVPVTVEVDLDIDGQIVNLDYVQEDLIMAVNKIINTDEIAEELVESISDFTGYCVNGLNLKTNS